MNKITCVLLVDDDDTTNFVNQMLLEDLKVTQQVLTASNGRDALQLMRKRWHQDNCPDLILPPGGPTVGRCRGPEYARNGRVVGAAV